MARIRVSNRGHVEPFHVMELLKAANLRAATHGDVLTLCAGQPSTPAPAAVRAAAIPRGEVLGYTDATGIAPLREAIAAHYAHMYALTVDPASIAVTTGSSAAFTALFIAAFDVGDVVLMTRPGYPAYRNTLQALGVRPVELECGPEVRFQPTLAMLTDWAQRHGGPPAGLILASPANPTGTVIAPAELAAIARWCEGNDVLLISDEIYHGITFADRATSAWETSRSSVLVGSMSKYFSMTGWRVGWLVLPPPLVRPIELLIGNLNICAPAISQVGAVAAFGDDARAELAGHVRRYAANRALVLDRLPELGITTWAPADGAFYAYAEISHLTNDSIAWCAQVLEATGVALTPGADFAPSRPGADFAPSRPGAARALDGATWFRLSFASSSTDVDEALTRLRDYVNSR